MLKVRHLQFLQKRWKGGKQHWSVLEKKLSNKDRALESFDDFYGSVFGNRWKSMRVALLTQHKYVAMVNNFGDTDKTCCALEMQGAINIRSLFELAKERLEKENLGAFSDKAVYKLEDRLGGIIQQQETREKMSIYPQEDDIPDKINFGKTVEKVHLFGAGEMDTKKSLGKAIEEDTEIDLQRTVDSEFGTGGLYEYMPASRIKGMEDWVPESQHYKYYQTTTDFPFTMELENEFTFPENLKLYTYEKGNCSDFISPSKSQTGVLSHYLMDGASILPPLFLGVKQGDKVLDACAAPGGKSLLMLQTMYPEILVCNDVQESRVSRIRKVMNEYLFDFAQRWEGKRCVLTQWDARSIQDFDMYDKILVDVPCTTDRHSVMESDNNIFKSTRVKERLKIPEVQSDILANCLRLLRPGGSLVYSTCSLSPVQNDGVVHMALQKVFHDYGITTTIKDLSLLVQAFGDIYKFENPKGLKYGQMVIPYLPANFGPMYFCKIVRN